MTGQWERVAFRDHLRGHPETAAEYAALKRELAVRLGDDREAYTDAKTEFILRVTRMAPGRSRRAEGLRPARRGAGGGGSGWIPRRPE